MKQRMKILIGYDGSGCAEAALDDLQMAGLPSEAEALVLSVTEVALPAPPPSSYEILALARAVHVPADIPRVYAKGSPAIQEAQSISERAAARLRINFPGWETTAEASVGSPAWELVRKADDWKPDLIVLGSHGHSALARFALGSVSQRVLTEARCSVRIARGRVEEADTPLRIVIGVDGSPASEAAVREVASRLWPVKSEVRVITVNDPLTPSLIGQFIPGVAKTVKESNQAAREWLKEILENASQRLGQSELKVSTEIHEGNPKCALAEAAERWGADCIFVGSVGFSNRIERFVLGSVSAAVAARAHCSVEVVRRPATNGGNNHERQSEYSRN
jgi:nucleotide-binding universal stress UspA family protein